MNQPVGVQFQPADLSYWNSIFSLSDCVQGLFKVGFDIINMFYADRQAQQTGFYPSQNLFFQRKLFMGGGTGVNDQRFGISDIGQMAYQLYRFNQFVGSFFSSLNLEC